MAFATTLELTIPATRRAANVRLLGQGIEPQNSGNNLIFNGTAMLWNEGACAPGRDLKPPLLRWPHGTCGDEYEWEKGTGPLSARQQIPSLGSSYLGVMGSDEICNLCALWGSALVYQANVYTRSVADMLAHIDYLYSRKIGKRGPSEILVEFGNEPYLDYGPATGTTAASYVILLTQFITALRSKYPNIKIIVPYRSSRDVTNTIWVHRDGFSEAMLAGLAAAKVPVDYWAFHNAYLPEGFESFASNAAFMSAMMASSTTFRADCIAARNLIQSYPIYANSKICVTEWKGGFDSTESHRRTVAAAVQDADTLREMIDVGVDFAIHHNLISGNNGIYSFAGATRIRTAHWWLFAWLRQLMVGEYVTVTATSTTSETIVANASTPGRASRVLAGTVFPLVAGFGTIRDTQVQLLLINKSQTDVSTTTLNYPGTNKTQSLMQSLSAVSNPFDLNDNETKYQIGAAGLSGANPFTFSLPAMSISYLRFNLGIGGQ